MIEISVPSLPHFDRTINLDGTDYDLSFRYNQRAEYYNVSIYLPDGTELAKGAVLSCRWPLFRNRAADPRMPRGMILALATGPDESPPRIGEIGPDRRVSLYYMTEEELAAL